MLLRLVRSVARRLGKVQGTQQLFKAKSKACAELSSERLRTFEVCLPSLQQSGALKRDSVSIFLVLSCLQNMHCFCSFPTESDAEAASMLAPLVGLPSRVLCLSYMSSILNRQLSSIVPDREPWAAIVRATMYHPRAEFSGGVCNSARSGLGAAY